MSEKFKKDVPARPAQITARLWVQQADGWIVPYREMPIARAVPVIYEPVEREPRVGLFSVTDTPQSMPRQERREFQISSSPSSQRPDASVVDYIAWRQ